MEKKEEKVVAVKAAEEPKASAKKPAVKKAAAKKEPAAKKAAAPRAGEEIIIQAGGGEWSVADLKAKALAANAAAGHRATKNMVFYVKPEERKVYYVAGKNTGSVDFD